MYKLLKIFLIPSIIAVLTACNKIEQFDAQRHQYSKNCIEGINYFQFQTGAWVIQLDTNGKPVTCNPVSK